MTLPGKRFRVLAAGMVLALTLAGYTGFQLLTSSPASAATSQFHGVNWADPNDNFITRPNVPVGLSTSDSYATVYTKATNVLKGFQSLGANTVRFGINTWTTSNNWWNSLVAAYDAANALGMNVIIAPWLQGGKISNTNDFNTMWDVVINKYGGNANFYFDMMNEPYGYSATDLTNAEAAWVARYPSIPRGRLILPGLWSDQNLCSVGADSRLSGTLLSLHIYGMFGESHNTEAAWVTSLQNNLCGYASRTVITEFGVPMTTGANYNGSHDGNNDVSYLYAITDTARSQGIGTVLWTGVKETNQTVGPGPCENASCAITSLNGSGTNLSLSITNRSGLDRLQYGWGGAPTSGSPSASSSPGGGFPTGNHQLVGTNGLCVDVYGNSSAAGALIDQWTCNGHSNQLFQFLAASGGYGELRASNSGLDIAVANSSTTGGTPDIVTQQPGTAANGLWLPVRQSDGSYAFQNKNSGLCLDVYRTSTTAGQQLDQWTCKNAAGTNQDFTVR